MGPSTTTFDARMTYSKQPEVYHDDGRELALLRKIFSLPPAELAKLRGNPEAILEFIDNYGATTYMMNIGEAKGRHITSLIAQHKPKTAIELGGYVGYSTLLFASALRRASGPDARYYCLEFDAAFGAIIMALTDLAGLRDVVHVLIGTGAEGIKTIARERGVKAVDFVLLDHMKVLYTHDLKVAEQLGLVKKGTLLVADNMTNPGNPEYRKYMAMSKEEKEKAMAGEEDADAKGRPGCVYECDEIQSFEPTGVPDSILVSRCVDVMAG
ncbi:S-adenosyl-L-methionine-dependent methyltransferase [Geopyxis carbonaria]|nr:S-adenosyl-L-methionine-dependent methyltransferase [Geopyxis carbonaria]